MKSMSPTNVMKQAAGVIGSATVILTVLWQFSIKPTLANDFLTHEDHKTIYNEVTKRIDRLENQDQVVLAKIDKVSDKIDDIYQLLIKIK